MTGSPDVGHENIAGIDGGEGRVEREDIRALAAEGKLLLGTAARIGMLSPRAPYAGRREHAGLVGRPSCAA